MRAGGELRVLTTSRLTIYPRLSSAQGPLVRIFYRVFEWVVTSVGILPDLRYPTRYIPAMCDLIMLSNRRTPAQSNTVNSHKMETFQPVLVTTREQTLLCQRE